MDLDLTFEKKKKKKKAAVSSIDPEAIDFADYMNVIYAGTQIVKDPIEEGVEWRTFPVAAIPPEKQELVDQVQLTDTEYPYRVLLNRVSRMAPPKQESKKLVLKPPNLVREGMKTLWINFQSQCIAIGRNTDHVISFVNENLGIHATMNTQGHLGLRGKWSQGQVESTLSQYMKVYLLCKQCKGHDTQLCRDSLSRSVYLCCHSCTVESIVPSVYDYFHNTQTGPPVQN